MLLNLINFLPAPLDPTDGVGISFWVITMAMVAATAFFFLETQRAEGKWKTSLVVAGLVTMVAAVHYFYMRAEWDEKHASPTVLRYIDWLITVPLQMIEFYLILAAITKVPLGVFWRLLLGTIVMLVGGYAGEAGLVESRMGAFAVGMAGWAFILYEIFAGQASKICAASAPAGVKKAYSVLRIIVSLGWSIYPLGYLFGGGDSEATLNVVYNIADFVNKIAFGAIIWSIATAKHDA